jgi:transposase-like protein
MSAEQLRREVAKLEVGRGQRYPAELKTRIVAWASSKHGPRCGWQKLGVEIGVHAETLRSWCAAREREAMKRVVVADARTRIVTIVTPSGLRAEMDLEDAMTLLAALR